MSRQKLRVLQLRDTDVQGAIHRCCDNESLYIYCLKEFISDNTINRLNTAIKSKAWDDAFTAAHALKGLAGNMGFIPLMHATGRLVVLIRGGRMNYIEKAMGEVNSKYRDIVDAINEFVEVNG